eukprot:TRINITY_DN1528_c0_g1_i1.p1 TRINITY_DN1528_c0_g1~~TRINITY_DN1528_c0_g1_i1.p1  ORF type:complete len:178 (+),score=31.97 TRINITY_DN1528_c0_g1_i1:90-623(+)
MTIIERGHCPIDITIFPVYFEGKVVHGFGRGSKQLGIPTANLPTELYEHILEKIPVGVYYGWANVEGGRVYKTAMSIGWNPYFKTTKKTIEVHIMHRFKEDFYGSHLRVIALGYIRPMCDFSSLEDLIAGIKGDIDYANEQLDLPTNFQFSKNEYFHCLKSSRDSSSSDEEHHHPHH